MEGSKHMKQIPEIISELPNLIQPFVEMIYDVTGDGHCGYRAISACLGPRWFYTNMSTNSSRNQKQKEMWMVMLAMAGPMANAFKRAIFFFSPSYSHAALSHFPNNPPIIIALISSRKHYVVLELKDHLPFPSPRPLSNRHMPPSNQALGWYQKYSPCFELLESMIR
ncbi:hypothetical protein VP01_5673g1 [Puccinia sorghi]|uniref:OTU domain-containing protein n=1 Tax=Puccinia sorghi TaxID=27349 RepID=A0A0L6UIV9_9BASI|nr:hypothetical protein VP01_5673g1 [Puccinia sorghi]